MAEIIKAKVPVLKKGYHRMTLPFGNQRLSGKAYLHKGVDLTGDTNANGGYDYILAFADGKVITAGYEEDTGYWVRIKHANGTITRYMHLKKGSIKVNVGDDVDKGQVIGYMGSTGNSTARHLHFDLSFPGNVTKNYGGFYVAKQNCTYVDPIPYLEGTKEIPGGSKPSLGTYIVDKNVNVRKGPGTNYNRVYYSQFTFNAKSQVKKLDKSCPDHFPSGIKLTIKEVKQATNGTWWGKCPSGWVCMTYLVKF